MKVNKMGTNLSELVFAIGEIYDNFSLNEANLKLNLVSGNPVNNNIWYRIYGTAFHISENELMSANHVFDSKNINKIKVFSYQKSGVLVYSDIEKIDKFENKDLIKIKVKNSFVNKHVFPTSNIKQELLTDIKTFGYPRSLDRYHTPRISAFKGYICSTRPLKHPFFAKNVDLGYAYELSFPAFEGLSGAPIITENGICIGVVIGSSEYLPFETRYNVDYDLKPKFFYGLASPIF